RPQSNVTTQIRSTATQRLGQLQSHVLTLSEINRDVLQQFCIKMN
ncbi:1230_t:CDS:1, partial [Diversispora eburnea]